MYTLTNRQEKNGETTFDLEITELLRDGEPYIFGQFHISKSHVRFVKTSDFTLNYDRTEAVWQSMKYLKEHEVDQ